jgi:deoxyhypusine synthase
VLDPEEPLPKELIPEYRAATKCKIFLGFTSNLISSGLRDVFRFLVKHQLVDVVVTTAGGIEEDIIKCLAPTFLGDFDLKGAALREKGFNRIGNLYVPNDNYTAFEDFMMPLLEEMHRLQDEEGVEWTPSKLVHRLGLAINDERSVYYWAAKNNIPVYSPAITDGSIGDMIYFHSYRTQRKTTLRLDIAADIRAMNDEAVHAVRSGVVILGGGVPKHHILNANLMRGGCDYAVYINTAQEFDGSDSGAKPDEAVSWGKISLEATPVKCYADATIVFPLVVAQTFARVFHERKAADAAEHQQ